MKTNKQLDCEKIILLSLRMLKEDNYITQEQIKKIFEIIGESEMRKCRKCKKEITEMEFKAYVGLCHHCAEYMVGVQ